MVGYWAAGPWVPAVTWYYVLFPPLTAAAILLSRRLDGRQFVVAVHVGLVVIGATPLVQSVWR